MNIVRLLVPVCGAIGVVAVLFFPFVAGIRAISVPTHGMILLFTYLIPLALGGFGAARGFTRWIGGVSLLCFLVAGMKSAGDGGDSGQTMMLLSAFVGMLAALAVAIAPGKRRA